MYAVIITTKSFFYLYEHFPFLEDVHLVMFIETRLGNGLLSRNCVFIIWILRQPEIVPVYIFSPEKKLVYVFS